MLRMLTQQAQSTTSAIFSKLKSATNYTVKVGNHYELKLSNFSFKNGYDNTLLEARYLFKITLFCGLPLAAGDVVTFMDHLGKTLYLLDYTFSDTSKFSCINMAKDLEKNCDVKLLNSDDSKKAQICFDTNNPNHNMTKDGVSWICDSHLYKGLTGNCFDFNLGYQPNNLKTENCVNERLQVCACDDFPLTAPNCAIDGLSNLELFGVITGSICAAGLTTFGIWKLCRNHTPAAAATVGDVNESKPLLGLV